MIKYSYTIRRDEGDETREYRPNLIPTELSDVVYIEGPNDSGKSTLLNMIALGFFGLKLKEDEISPALREKLENLYRSKHQEIIFNIEIQNKSLSTTLISEKLNFKNKDFVVKKIVHKKEYPISPEQFKKEYKLIYDIPINPLRRLPELLNEIKTTQRSTGNQVATLRLKIQNAIENVKNARDPEQERQLKQTAREYNENYKELKKVMNKNEEFILDLKKFYLTKYYLENIHKANEKKEYIELLKKARKSVDRKMQKQTQKQAEILEKMKNIRGNADECYDESTDLLKLLIPKSEDYHLKIWLDSEVCDEIYNSEANNSLRIEAKYFKNYLHKLKEADDENKVIEARFISSLLKFMQEFSQSNLIIPGTNKRVEEFIHILQKRNKKFEDILIKNKNIDDCIKTLEGLLTLVEEGIMISCLYKEAKKSREKGIEDYVEKEDEDDLKKQIEKCKKIEEHIKYYSIQLLRINVDPSNAFSVLNKLRNTENFEHYEVYKESQLFERINEEEGEIIKIKEKLKKLERSITEIKSEIKKLKMKEPHKYQNYFSDLEKLQRVVLILEQKMHRTFNDYIKKIMDPKTDYNDLDGAEKKYAEKIAEFLAAKVRFIKYDKKNHEIKRIDVINKKIITESNKEINFLDLGTGHSQGAYLEGLLSMSEDKKIIALFDEVAMMDSQTLKPILNKLKKLHKENKLVLGIIVQKADEVKIRSLI